MNQILDAEPNTGLVVLNGDLITGENTFLENSTHYIDQIVAPMVQRDLTWAGGKRTLAEVEVLEDGDSKGAIWPEGKRGELSMAAGILDVVLPVTIDRRQHDPDEGDCDKHDGDDYRIRLSRIIWATRCG